MFYTYAHYKPDNSVFYIGKGQRHRAWSVKDRNPYWRNVVAKHKNHKVEILAEWPTEQEAFDHEKFLIWCFRDMGKTMSDEHRAIISATHKGKKQSPEQIKKRIASRLATLAARKNNPERK